MTGFAQQLASQSYAPAGMLFGILGVLLCALVFFVVLRLLTSALGFGASCLFRGSRAAAVKSGAAIRTGVRPRKVCSNARCRKVNIHTARFCAQCGARM